jgi:hypothetical protein
MTYRNTVQSAAPVINGGLKSVAINDTANSYIHPYWGVGIRDGDTPKISETDVKFGYEDYILRETGIQRQMINNNNLIQALSKPEDYLNKKNYHLREVGTEVAEVYKNAQQKFINNGYSYEKAREKALAVANDRKDYLMKLHEDEFPTHITNAAIDKQKKISNI